MATEHDSPASRPRRAGAFDIRTIIALLFVIYGAVLFIMGIGFTSEADQQRAAGVNINLWTGVGLLLTALLFYGWARLRPVAVPTEPTGTGESADTAGGEH